MVSPDADRSVKGGGGMPCAAFGAPIMHPPHMTGIPELPSERALASVPRAYTSLPWIPTYFSRLALRSTVRYAPTGVTSVAE